MAGSSVTELLRPGLLEDVSIMLAAAPSPPEERLASAIGEACAALGASFVRWPLDAGEQALAEKLRGGETVDLLVLDAGSAFVAATAGELGGQASPRAALARCMQLSWEVTRTLASACIGSARATRIVLIAPAASACETELELYARAARAGLENLARTLSIEWSRHAITTLAIAPAPDTDAGELAALCAYLASPAGAYFSGCLLAPGALGR